MILSAGSRLAKLEEVRSMNYIGKWHQLRVGNIRRLITSSIIVRRLVSQNLLARCDTDLCVLFDIHILHTIIKQIHTYIARGTGNLITEHPYETCESRIWIPFLYSVHRKSVRVVAHHVRSHLLVYIWIVG